MLAGALAAVTAALLGSTMGVAGTVVGAGLASVVSTVGGALYLRSIERTRRERAHRPRQGRRPLRRRDRPGRRRGPRGTDDTGEPDAEVEADTRAAGDRPGGSGAGCGGRCWSPAACAAFALGMLAMTGVEWMRGEPLSGGTGTTFGSIVDAAPRQRQPSGQRPAGDPSTPPSSTTPTTDDAPELDRPAGPTTTSTAPPPRLHHHHDDHAAARPPRPRGQTPPGGTIPPSD